MTRDDWQTVLDAHRGTATHSDVRVQAGALSRAQVSATVAVDRDAAGAVEFGDNLYGATAWSTVDGAWRRVDTARMRLMIAPSLQPGQRAEIVLPLDGEHESVRVLLGDTWTDVRR